ncbi:MAG: VWA domain-containing protein, partial [Planctomycetes bacterium]|nr:VWA domain-containing protein [Planctomycetota bacterium]
MIEFQIPELILLAIPLWFVLYRWGRVPAETVWLLAVPVWLVFAFLDFSAFESERLRTVLAACQRFSGWFLPLPVWLGLRRHFREMGVTDWLRLSILLLLIVCLGGPRFNVGGKGVDVIVVIDRSGSLSAEAAKTIEELDQSLDGHRRAGDRLGRIVFGREARIERILSEFRRPAQSGLVVSADGSDLNDALLKALSLVDPNRPARILVLSDGESNGPSPFAAARRAGEERVPIEYRLFERSRAGDVAVKSLDVPEDVYPNEPFYFTAVIHSDGASQGRIRLFRVTYEKGKSVRKLIREKSRRFHSGLNVVQFQHQSNSPGTFKYEVEVDVSGDPEQGNNSCAGVVRVVGP